MKQLLALLFVGFVLCSCSSASKSDSKAFETLVEINSIKALLFKPEGKGPFPAIVGLHGCGGLWRGEGNLNAREREWAKHFVELGFVVLFPDSFTSRGYPKGICHEAGAANEMHQVERPQDAYAALQWLQRQTYIQPEKIILMGWSNGGSTLLATLDENQKARPKDLKYDFHYGLAFYPGCFQTTKNPIWKNIIPISIFHGEKDDWCLARYCQKLSNQHGLDLHLYADAYHDFDAPNMPLKKVKDLPRAPGASKGATVGTNEKARQEAFSDVSKILQGLK